MGKKAALRFNPAVRNAPTFSKKKIKVGRQLRHDNATNTSVSAKRIVLTEQLKGEEEAGDVKKVVKREGGQGPSQQQRRKSMEELVAQIGHYNENMCREAINGILARFKEAPELLHKHMRTVIPGIGVLLLKELSSTTTRNQLKRLIDLVCAVPSEVMSSHFNLFCTYALTGISDVRQPVRTLSFDVLLLLMKKHPELCAKSDELFSAFLQHMEGQRKPENKMKLLESLCQFIAVFGRANEADERNRLWPQRTLHISFGDANKASCSADSAVDPEGIGLLLPSAAYFHFPVLYPDTSCAGNNSPLQSRAGILRCCKVLCPVLDATIRTEEDADCAKFNSIMTKAHQAVSQLLDVALRSVASISSHSAGQQNADESEHCAQLGAAFAPLRRSSLVGASKKLSEKMDKLLGK